MKLPALILLPSLMLIAGCGVQTASNYLSNEMNAFVYMIDAEENDVREALRIYGEDEEIWDDELVYFEIQDVEVTEWHENQNCYDVKFIGESKDKQVSILHSRIFRNDNKINDIQHIATEPLYDRKRLNVTLPQVH